MRVLALVTAALLLPLSALASTYTYTYTGNTYQLAIGNYTKNESITASFTLDAPLALNLSSLTSISGAPFSVSDGVQTIDSATPSLIGGISVETNAVGAIDFWTINVMSVDTYSTLFGVPIVRVNRILSLNLPSGDHYPWDYAFNGQSHNGYAGQAENEYDPGTWALTITDSPPSPTPEPATLTLAATGLVSLAGLARRKTRR